MEHDSEANIVYNSLFIAPFTTSRGISMWMNLCKPLHLTWKYLANYAPNAIVCKNNNQSFFAIFL